MSAPRPSTGRKALSWVLSIVGGGLFLWLASMKLRIFPDALDIVSVPMLVGAAALYVVYAAVRALRLQYVLDPLVDAATPTGARFDRRVLYGSGFLSFFVLLVLPLKLGELSRPLLLTRARQPGVQLTEAVTAVGLERVVDGLVICAMLFGGLAFAEHADTVATVQVQHAGRIMLAVIGLGLVVLLVAAKNPDRAADLAARIASIAGDAVAKPVRTYTRRLAVSAASILDLRRAASFVGWSVVYWAITIAQLWMVLRASGLQLGVAEASAIVAIIGLSIQLPGGPAQTGTFQVGAGLALGLFLPDTAMGGAGSTFAVLMYLLQLLGAAVFAIPGLWLMARAAPRENTD